MLTAIEVARRIEAFATGTDGEALKSKELTLALLAWSPEPFSRDTFTPGHVTCTGLVLSPDKSKILLVHHRRLDRWLLPGGHCESGDPGVESVAEREVIEETGAAFIPKGRAFSRNRCSSNSRKSPGTAAPASRSDFLFSSESPGNSMLVRVARGDLVRFCRLRSLSIARSNT
jgi:hypothetical protein